MSAQHTQGRLHVGDGNNGRRIIYDERGWAVADAKLFHARRQESEDIENARRLVACWNILEGIDTEKLESYKSLHDYIAEQTYITSFQDGLLGLKGTGPLLIGAMFSGLYDARNPKNYVEMAFSHTQTGEEFVVTTQRKLGKTPHQLRAEAEAQRDELLVALEDLHGQVRHFCETQGEADFETGRAVAIIAKVKGGAT